MSDHERNGWRDETYSREHRQLLPDFCEGLDGDWIAYNPSWRPLYIAELAYAADANPPYKPASVTGCLARMARIPAFVVQYETERPLRFCEHCGQPVPGSAGAITYVHVRDAARHRSPRHRIPAAEWWSRVREFYP